jgi:hypothetical protein
MLRLTLILYGTLCLFCLSSAQITVNWTDRVFLTGTASSTQTEIATNSSGDVYLTSTDDLQRLSASGSLLSAIPAPSLAKVFSISGSERDIVVPTSNPNFAIYVVNRETGTIIDGFSGSITSSLISYDIDPNINLVIASGNYNGNIVTLDHFNPVTLTFDEPIQFNLPAQYWRLSRIFCSTETTVVESLNNATDYCYTCIDNETGITLWTIIRPVGTGIAVHLVAPITKDQTVFVYKSINPFYRSHIESIAQNGQLSWSTEDFDLGSSTDSVRISLQSNTVVVRDSGTTPISIKAFSLITGLLKATYVYDSMLQPLVYLNEVGDVIIQTVLLPAYKWECFNQGTQILKWFKTPSNPGFEDIQFVRSGSGLPMILEGSSVLKAIDSATGSISWQKPILRSLARTSRSTYHKRLQSDKSLFVIAHDNSTEVTVRNENGTTATSRFFGGAFGGAEADLSTGMLYIVGDSPPNLFCLDALTLNTIFSVPITVGSTDFAYVWDNEVRLLVQGGGTAQYNKVSGNYLGSSSSPGLDSVSERRVDSSGNVLRLGGSSSPTGWQWKISRDCFDGQQSWTTVSPVNASSFGGFSSFSEFAVKNGEQLTFFSLANGSFVRTVPSGIPAGTIGYCRIVNDRIITTFIDSSQLFVQMRSIADGSLVWQTSYSVSTYSGFRIATDISSLGEDLLVFWKRDAGNGTLMQLDFATGSLISYSMSPMNNSVGGYNPEDIRTSFDMSQGTLLFAQGSRQISSSGIAAMIGQLTVDRLARWSGITVSGGMLLGGTVSSLQWNDDNVLTLFADEFDSSTIVEIAGNVSPSTRAHCAFAFRSKSSHPSLLAIYRAYNWNSNVFVNIASQFLTTNESEVRSPTLAKSSFVRASDGLVKFQAITLPTIDLSSFDGWTVQTDLCDFRLVD